MFSSNQNAWFMNESLAFYMSTNTFSNPIFDAQVDPDSSQQEQQNEDTKIERSSSLNRSLSSSSTASNDNENNNKEQQQRYWASFCDSLMFSIKSKLYVFELNFKRKLQRLKRFASGHLPIWLLNNLNVLGGSGSWRQQATASASFEYEDEDKFWEAIQQPYSKVSFSIQQEKILSRLEQLIQAKRSSSKGDDLEQEVEQQQHEEGELFNMAQPELNTRLRLNRSDSSELPSKHIRASGAAQPALKVGDREKVRMREKREVLKSGV